MHRALQLVDRIGREVGRGVLQLLYPRICHLCGTLLEEKSAYLCEGCATGLAGQSPQVCPRCARVVGPHVVVPENCPHCRDVAYHFDRAVRLGAYEGLVRDAVLRIKSATGEGLAETLGELLAQRILSSLPGEKPELVVPVPLHWRRRLRRGYNQSETVARLAAARLKLRLETRWLRRVVNTPPQTAQSAEQRRANVRNAFRADRKPRCQGKCVLLIDDVLTTGSTCSEAARALKLAGAGRVVVGILATA